MEYDSNATATSTTTEGRDNNDNVVSYQIDVQTTKKGKMFAGTKRRICWKFGFSDRDSVRRGLSGTDCRGEEHEVVFVWSLTSGKKFVLADGHEVHWSKQSPITEKFEGGWECSWQSEMAGKKRLLRVVAPSSPLFEKRKTNKNSSVADSSFCNFDLLIDGVSFSKLSQMFELGLTKTMKNKGRISLGGIDTLFGNTTTQLQHLQQQQQQQLQRRKDIYDNSESDAVSHYSHNSHQSSPPGLLYSRNSHHSSQPELMYSHNSSQPNLLYIQEPPHRQQQQQQPQHQHTPLAACNQLMSQSMPDMRFDFSTSPTSVLGGGDGGSIPQLNYHWAQQQQQQHQLQQPNEVSPTSVTAANPIDLYSHDTFKPQQQQQQTHAQHNNNYVPRPEQHQPSTVFGF
jgi:hypothetical protein